MLAVVGAVVGLAVSSASAGAQTPPTVEWIDGADAYEVAIAAVGGSCASLAGSDGSVELALATGENWPDALAASALDRPLLLSRSNALHQAVRRFVQGCPGTVDIVILGGTAAISQHVQDELVALGTSVQRIAGADRYETARKIAELAAPSQVSQVYLATGSNFADAIAAAPRVTASTPIILTPKASLGADASAFLSARLGGNGRVVILGGTAAVSQTVRDEVAALKLNPRRIAGADRYSTAAMIASESLSDPRCDPVTDVAIASGTDPYGGLAAASVRNPCQPLLLAPRSGASVPKAISDFAETWADVLASQTGLTGTITAAGPRSTISSQAVQQLAGVEPQGGSSSADDDPQEANVEQYLNDYVAVSASEGSPGALAWWRRPRGDLSINVHVCVEQGFEHHFAQADLADYAAHYNRAIAPFYSWQSSGMLNVSFQPGQVIASNVLANAQNYGDWGSALAPSDCLDRFRPIRPRVGHAFLVYYANARAKPDAAGRGQLGGPFSGAFLRHVPSDPSPAEQPLSSLAAGVVRHEVDHNVGVPHLNERNTGPTRAVISVRQLSLGEGYHPSGLYYLSPDNDAIVGALDGYPEEVERRQYTVFACYDVMRFGWPTGDGHPACVRVPPPQPVSVSLVVKADGSARITWQMPPHSVNREPVTGYDVSLQRVRRTTPGTRNPSPETTVAKGTVASSTTSYSLPAGSLGVIDYGAEYTALVTPTSAVGPGGSGRASFQVLPPTAQITATQRPAFDTVDAPIVFDLSWTPAPNATSYKICGFRICQDSRNALPVNGTTYVLSEQLNHVAEGESYDITVWACGTAYETVWVQRLRAPPGCFRYATTTITAQSATATTPPALKVVPTPLGTCSWQHSTTGEVHPCHRVTWASDSRADSYFVHWGECDAGVTTCPTPDQLTHAPRWLGGNAADLFLEPGTRYLVRVYACPAPADPGQCHPWGGNVWLVGETQVTTSDSGT